jgi:hypothetical protein
MSKTPTNLNRSLTVKAIYPPLFIGKRPNKFTKPKKSCLSQATSHSLFKEQNAFGWFLLFPAKREEMGYLGKLFLK